MTTTAPTGTPPSRAIAPRLGAWLAIVVAALPLLGAGALLAAAGLPDYALDGDGALVELRIAEATRLNQWLGSYSRLGFEHPGALHLYLCAPFYAAFDARTGALNLAVLTLQSAALATSLILAVRAAGPTLAVSGAIAASLYVASLGQTLMTIWDPAMAILPLWLCIAAAGLAAGGRPWAALPAVLAGSFAVQAHLSLVPPVAAAFAVLTVAAILARRSAPAGAGRAYAVSAAVGLLSIAPTLLEQLSSEPGNLTLIAEALGAEGPRPSLGDALRITAEQLTAPIRELIGLGAGAAPWIAMAQVLAGAWALVLALRSRARALTGLAAVALAVQVAAPLAVLRIVGEIRPHMLQWIATAGALGLWPVLAAVWIGPPGRRGTAVRWAMALGLGLTCTYVGVTRIAAETLVFIATVEKDPGGAAGTPGLSLLLDEITRTIPDGQRELRLRVLAADAPRPGYPDFTAGNGLVLGLKKRGFVVAPEPAHAFAYPRRMSHPGEGALHLVLHDPSNVHRIAEPAAALASRDYGVIGFSLFAEAPALRAP
jgi:hypothetical protein